MRSKEWLRSLDSVGHVTVMMPWAKCTSFNVLLAKLWNSGGKKKWKSWHEHLLGSGQYCELLVQLYSHIYKYMYKFKKTWRLMAKSNNDWKESIIRHKISIQKIWRWFRMLGLLLAPHTENLHLCFLSVGLQNYPTRPHRKEMWSGYKVECSILRIYYIYNDLIYILFILYIVIILIYLFWK